MASPPQLPLPNESGAFGPLLGPPAQEWPWALPSIHTVNTYTMPGELITGASADPDGVYLEEHYQAELGYVEVVGYWQRCFHVLHSRQHVDLASAKRDAERTFRD